MIGLKPCPFCGGEAHIKEVVSACETLYTAGCSDSECMGYETWLLKPTKEEAIAAWNRRAERTCHLIDCPPSTCARKEGWATWPKCSECGEAVRRKANYCSNCGAKVVDS